MFIIGTIINILGAITGNLFIKFLFTIRQNEFNIDVDGMSILVFVVCEFMLLYVLASNYEIKEEKS